MIKDEFEVLIMSLEKIHDSATSIRIQFGEIEEELGHLILFLQQKEQLETSNILGDITKIPAEVGKTMTEILQGIAKSFGINLEVKKNEKEDSVKEQKDS